MGNCALNDNVDHMTDCECGVGEPLERVEMLLDAAGITYRSVHPDDMLTMDFVEGRRTIKHVDGVVTEITVERS